MTTQADILRAVATHSTGACPLQDFVALELHGPDAMGFAQAQFAGDLRPLSVGHWQWNCWLSSQGRVIALLLLLRTDADRLCMVLPDPHAEALAQQLRRYVFRSKVTIERAAVSIYGGRTGLATPLARSGAMETDFDGAAVVRLGGCMGRSVHVAAACPDVELERARLWPAADIVDAIPWLSGAAIEAWIPQALGLDRLAAFSTAKGCYPGQEIVARTHFLGRNKRHLMRATLDATSAPVAGERLLDDTASDREAAAMVVSSALAGDHALALVVAREGVPSTLRLASSGATAILAELD